ncbi:MAG: zf-HC2 domain-containing protein [Blastocatellia bacterium]|nr:zf-HC2 domain-containing protein [Blastocatellia bacterium]
MDCQVFEELISEHLDGELKGSEAAAFRSHQMSCPTCRSLLDAVSEAVGVCMELQEAEPPLELLSRALVIPALYPPIDCDRFAALVTEFLDGFLEASVYHAFENHAQSCDGCSDTLAGVALAVSACHSVHFSEDIEVPESLIASILAETSGSGILAKAAAKSGLAGRIVGAIRLFAGPALAPRVATAAVILATFSMLVMRGGLAPAEIYDNAARVTSRVYSRSADFAARTDEVLSEVERFRSDVNEIFDEPTATTPDGAPSSGGESGTSAKPGTAGSTGA